MRFRSLPEGVFREAEHAGWDGHMLQIKLSDGQPGPDSGTLVEVESDSRLYLGEVRQSKDLLCRILIEHSLERARLASVKDSWR